MEEFDLELVAEAQKSGVQIISLKDAEASHLIIIIIFNRS